MSEITEVPVRLAGQQVDAVTAIETWLQTQVEPQFALLWRPSGGWNVQVRSTAQLTDCLSALSSLAAWGVLERMGGVPWAQAMRVDGGFVVEVNGHDWAQRVTPIGSLGPDGPRTSTRNLDLGREPHGTSFLEGENIPTASSAAQILWSWVCGGLLPAGFQLRNVRAGRE